MAGRPAVGIMCLGSDACRGLAAYVERHGCEPVVADEFWQADQLLAGGKVEIAVVGPGRSGEDGLELLRLHGASSGASFLVLAGRADVLSRVLALELGAADVVDAATPEREIMARIRGILSRRGRPQAELLVLEKSTVDLKAALVMHSSGAEELLSPGQIALLRLFMSRPRIVLSRDDIMAAAPAEASDAYDRSIDSRIVRLRRKLDTETIVTVRGSGYRFDPPTNSAVAPLPRTEDV